MTLKRGNDSRNQNVYILDGNVKQLHVEVDKIRTERNLVQITGMVKLSTRTYY